MEAVCRECRLCNVVFTDLESWTSHTAIHSANRESLQPPVKETVLPTKKESIVIYKGGSLSMHDSVITTNLIHKCDLCNKILRDEHTLKCHTKTVHGEKKLSCSVCGKKFPHKGRGVLSSLSSSGPGGEQNQVYGWGEGSFGKFSIGKLEQRMAIKEEGSKTMLEKDHLLLTFFFFLFYLTTCRM